jgi:hypothetical protein
MGARLRHYLYFCTSKASTLVLVKQVYQARRRSLAAGKYVLLFREGGRGAGGRAGGRQERRESVCVCVCVRVRARDARVCTCKY